MLDSLFEFQLNGFKCILCVAISVTFDACMVVDFFPKAGHFSVRRRLQGILNCCLGLYEFRGWKIKVSAKFRPVLNQTTQGGNYRKLKPLSNVL